MLTPLQPYTYLARAVATTAEARKREKCAQLSRSHYFISIAIEASVALGPDAFILLNDIGKTSGLCSVSVVSSL